MAHIWIEATDAEWWVQPLSGEPVALAVDRDGKLGAHRPGDGEDPSSAVLLARR